MKETFLEALQLKKSYGAVEALRGVDLAIRGGEIFALLGPNGAGKTTCLEILEGLRKADSGSVRYFGSASPGIDDGARERMGAQLQHSAFFPHLTVEEMLRMLRSLYGRRTDVEALIRRFSLTEKRKALVKSLSGGQLQRLALAGALVNDPELVFLDEPTTGLDTQTRRSLWEEVRALAAGGAAVVVTTHYMDEAENLADRVAIIDNGRVIAEGTVPALLSDHGETDLEAVFLKLTGRALRD